MGRMRVPLSTGDGVIASGLMYDNVVGMVRSALDSPYVKRIRMLTKSG